MARIKIEIPGKPLAVVAVPVRITDINYGNHVGNHAFVMIIHEARMQWLQNYGYTELQIEGVGLIMSGLAIEFKNESFYPDQVQVSIHCGEITKVGFELYYRLSVHRSTGELILAHATTGMVCYDYAAGKVAALPEKLRGILTLTSS